MKNRPAFSFIFLLLIAQTVYAQKLDPRFDANEYEKNFKGAEVPPTQGLLTLDPANLDCTRFKTKEKGPAKLNRCEATTDAGKARMNTLILEGTFAETSYQHGFLLAEEMENGSLIEALKSIQDLESGIKSKYGRAAIESLFACYQKHMEKTLDSEFKGGVAAVAQGYLDGMKALGKTPIYTAADITSAAYTIELGNIFGAIQYQAETNIGKAIKHVVFDCGARLAADELIALKDALLHLKPKNKFACTGAVVPGNLSRDGHLYHARNLEQTAMIESWNRNPVTFLIHETGHYKYVAFGTAGLIFPGGISGYNEKGISVSTHEMDPSDFGIHYKRGTAAMTPYLQQRILREAASIDDAIRIAKSVNNFNAWTMLVSDAKTNESVSIEVTKKGATAVRRRKNEGMGQSNYFLAPENQKLEFHDNYNFFLESYSRLKIVESTLQNGAIGLANILSLLASHVDWFAGDISYGRGVARVMNIMSTIVAPDLNRVWVTLSDRFPSNQGYYLSYDVDFEKMTLTPTSAIKTADYAKTPHWEKSFSLYQLADRAHIRGDELEARKIMEEALSEAQKDGHDDSTYHYLIGRFYLREGNADAAFAHFKAVENQLDRLDPIRRANLRLYELYALDHLTAQTEDSASVEQKRATWKTQAEAIYNTILSKNENSNYFPLAPGGVLQAEKDLHDKLKLLNLIYTKSPKVKIPKPNMKNGD